MKYAQRITALLAGLGLGLSAAPAIFADDTEIFVQVIPPSPPNILLVIDSSGSMDSDVVVLEGYDPEVIYEGSCDTNHVYFAQDTSTEFKLPTCTPDETDRYVNADAFFCQAARDAFGVSGFYVDRAAQWDEGILRWANLGRANDLQMSQERFVECSGDFGVDGNGTDPDLLWPANNATGPWTDLEDSEDVIDWLTLPKYTFYSANYINWLESNPETAIQTRMEIVQDVASELFASVAGVRIGLMRFSRNGEGGMVVHPVLDVEDVRQTLTLGVNSILPGGTTPLAETMYEAGQYMGGRLVDYGLTSEGNNGIELPSVDAARNGPVYSSPILDRCQQSYVVLLTDGLPVGDMGGDERIEDIAGACVDSCLDEMSGYLAATDQRPLIQDDQIVETYTIGFFVDQDLLMQTATAVKSDGSPGYFTTEDVSGLAQAFTDILVDIAERTDTFSSPSISVDTFNRLTNRNELYFPLFVASGAPHWDGNIKKYTLGQGEGGEASVIDADGAVAIDAATGLFIDGTRSFWSAEPDGDRALSGGLRSRYTADRTIYAEIATNLAITAADNRFHEDNEALSAEILGVEEEERDSLIKFLRGVDDEGNVQPILGDPLHTEPLILSYGGTEANPDLALFFTTNHGYFHAIDPAPPTGSSGNIETFAFIPNVLLDDLRAIAYNPVQNPVRKAYGLDGPMSYWIRGDDGDGVVESGEQAIVYFGMRRGGSNYYAMDVTDRSSPSLAWKIEGGVSGDFEEMGQSWSAPTVGTIDIGGSERTVLFLGGGYSTVQDSPGAPRQDPDPVGKAIYVVDAQTGERLWWASSDGAADLTLDAMTNSIPSDIRVLDTNLDGLADRLYVGDMGGRMWRFDIDNEENADGNLAITGGVIADLQGEDAAGNRRFYAPPSVARVVDPDAGSFLTISIGSGHRANPLGTPGLHVADRFYMIRDPNVFSPLLDESGDADYPTITEDELIDVTTDASPEVDLLNGASGWYIRLTDTGEKVLAPALTADNKIFFTTYLPSFVTPSCDLAGVLGSGRLYAVNLFSGSPVLYDDPDQPDPIPDDRFTDLDRGGIPPEPIPIFTPPDCEGEGCGGNDDDDDGDGDGDPATGCANPYSQVTLLIATETADPSICNAPVRTFWSEEDIDR